MADRIFFKDKTNTLKGPFSERQVQEWYRKGWFDNGFPFYFIGNDENPSDEENSGSTLASLRSLNGFGCPFFKVDGKEEREFDKKRRDREEKLESIEKEIAELHQQCDTVLCLEKIIERMEKELEGLVTPPGNVVIEKNEENVEEVVNSDNAMTKKKKKDKKKIDKPRFIPADIWEQFYETGTIVASTFLCAFDVFKLGNFEDWNDKFVEGLTTLLRPIDSHRYTTERRNLVCEYILVEKMKKRDYFCCSVCNESFFNYKQTLIHFMSSEHCKMLTSEVRDSGIDSIRDVIDSFAKLPAKLAENDAKIEQERGRRNGPKDPIKLRLNAYRPDCDKFCIDMIEELANAVCEAMKRYPGSDTTSMVFKTMFDVELAKGEFGRKKLADLSEQIGQAETYCRVCDCVTGDREGFFEHVVSSSHMRKTWDSMKKKGNNRIDFITTLVNVHRKDFI